jgi:hypothetical protein
LFKRVYNKNQHLLFLVSPIGFKKFAATISKGGPKTSSPANFNNLAVEAQPSRAEK